MEPVYSDTPRVQGNVSDCTGCENTQVLITRILCDNHFLSDVNGCWKTQLSDCTSYTVLQYTCNVQHQCKGYKITKIETLKH